MIIAAIFNKVFRRRKPLPKLINQDIVDLWIKAQKMYDDEQAAKMLQNGFTNSYTPKHDR